MIAHQITLEWSDGAAELLALDFDTGRIVVRWGSGLVTHVGAYRFDHGANEWRRESVPHGYRVEALAGPAGHSRCQDLGRMDDRVTARAVFDELACAVSWLRERAVSYSPRVSIPERARAVARWLLGMQSTLVNAHGSDLFDTLACFDALGGVEVDNMLGELVRLGVIYPNACMPRSDAITTHDTNANVRACFAGRFVIDNLPAVWAEHTAGAKHWLYQRGPAWESCTGLRGGYSK